MLSRARTQTHLPNTTRGFPNNTAHGRPRGCNHRPSQTATTVTRHHLKSGCAETQATRMCAHELRRATQYIGGHARVSNTLAIPRPTRWLTVAGNKVDTPRRVVVGRAAAGAQRTMRGCRGWCRGQSDTINTHFVFFFVVFSPSFYISGPC